MKTAYELQLEQRILAQDMRLRHYEIRQWRDYEGEHYLRRWCRMIVWFVRRWL